MVFVWSTEISQLLFNVISLPNEYKLPWASNYNRERKNERHNLKPIITCISFTSDYKQLFGTFLKFQFSTAWCLKKKRQMSKDKSEVYRINIQLFFLSECEFIQLDLIIL